MKRRFVQLALALLLAVSVAGSAWAITLTEAAKKAARQHNAKVLSARTVKQKGERVHEIKLLTKEGVVKTVRIPEKAG